ncbi:MAG: hypothetical protein ISP49_10160 [Reyranella sp.]|nr:hypothetical protein [Reyranella sp.]MBL6651945.1 hypothetical protein [Reyranella sp.]
MTRHTIVGLVGVLAAASISVAAGWAQPRETRMLSGPMTERLFHLANCKAAELEACKSSCASDNNKNQCITGCEARCALER